MLIRPTFELAALRLPSSFLQLHLIVLPRQVFCTITAGRIVLHSSSRILITAVSLLKDLEGGYN